MKLSSRMAFLMFVFLVFSTAVGFAEDITRERGLDRLFERTSGWIGGDGVSSIPLNDRLIFWAFGDSWIGRVFNGSRCDARMINNAIALQKKDHSKLFPPEFFWKTPRRGGTSRNNTPSMAFSEYTPHRGDTLRNDTPSMAFSEYTPHRGDTSASETPEAFFVPPDHRGWFWPLHGIVTSRGLFLFLLQLEKTSDDEFFGFKNIGTSLVQIPNYLDSPGLWQLIYRKVPWSLFSKKRNVFWGSSVLRFGKELFVYGIDENLEQPGAPKKMILGKMPVSNLFDFTSWSFWNGTTWTNDFRKAAPLVDEIATEFSVTAIPAEEPLLLISMEKNLSRRILFSRATKPEGPWETPHILYTITDNQEKKNAFCYAAKAHPELSSNPDELFISFVVNSLDFWEIVRNAEFYWPRFLRLPMKPLYR